MYKDAKSFIKHGLPCQQNKPVTTKPLGLLQPIPPTPTQNWDELTIKFITHLPSYFGHTVIWVICDRLSKFANVIALPTSFTASQLANRFYIEICRFSKHNIYLSKRPFISKSKTISSIHRVSAHHHTSRVPCHSLCWTLEPSGHHGSPSRVLLFVRDV